MTAKQDDVKVKMLMRNSSGTVMKSYEEDLQVGLLIAKLRCCYERIRA